jgi:hypothetical protein
MKIQVGDSPPVTLKKIEIKDWPEKFEIRDRK